MTVRTVAAVGSTGSIGTQTLEVVADDPERYRITALAAGRSLDTLVAQAEAVRPEFVAIGDASLAGELRSRLDASIEVGAGSEGLAECARRADVVVNGVVGFAGLPVTLAALTSGRRLALANKESLIAAGPVVQAARATTGAELVPVDSEHAAIHMCLRANEISPGAAPAGPGRATDEHDGRRGVARLQLTASGGPFRGRSAAELADVTVEEALAHPTWAMGPKITVDSSTLMNKGLEVIEAHELFGRSAPGGGWGIGFDDIDVVVHPQSIVHSMVTFTDGATIAQLSAPDMRLPIAYALAYPDRSPNAYGGIGWGGDLASVGTLTFEPPDRSAFECLDLAFEAGRIGGTAPAWLNAANEVAVDAFLKGRIRWVDIADTNRRVLERHDGGTGTTLDGVLEGDRQARALAESVISNPSP